MHENIRKVLIGVRLGASDFNQLSPNKVFDYVAEAKSIERLCALNDKNAENLGAVDLLELTGDVFNTLRYGVADGTALAVGTIRNLTSNRIYQLGEKPDSEYL